MTIPTRFIEKAEFEKLVADNDDEADLLIKWALTPFFYKEGEVGEGMWMESAAPVAVLFLNLVEPVIYRDKERNEVLIIANQYNDWTYTEVEDLHPRRGADMYMLNFWGNSFADMDYPLSMGSFVFKTDTMKFDKVDIEDVLPMEKRGAVH